MKSCADCEYHRQMNSRKKGVKIPDGTGKCIRPGGHCDPDEVVGGIGQPRVIRHPKEEAHGN